MIIKASILLLICLMGLQSGCTKKEPPTSEALKEFTVKGIVIRVEDEGRTLVLKHEAMPGYMGAMTMPFRVKKPEEVDGISPGDEIRFTYKVAELSSWVEDLQPTGNKEEIQAEPARKEPSSKLLKVGELFPDFQLLDENGSTVQLTDYRGSAVALTFIFTRCPVPEFCPTMMRNFHEVDSILKTDPEAPENFKLLTVSFDSEFDTPEVMKAYGERFDQNKQTWKLLTSPNEDHVKSLGEAVGLMLNKNKNAIYSHNLRTVVLDGTGRITKIFTDESWKPEALVAEIKSAAMPRNGEGK